MNEFIGVGFRHVDGRGAHCIHRAGQQRPHGLGTLSRHQTIRREHRHRALQRLDVQRLVFAAERLRCLVGDFLTPNIQCDYTHPRELKQEIAETVGDYLLDVRDFRTDNKDKILADIYEMTEKRFKLAFHFLESKPWDYFMMVEMGTDRIHHAFWSYMDPKHRAYEPGHRFEQAIFEYYKFLDGKLGELLKKLPPETHLFIVSDHGAKRMDGGICINDWLIREGYLHLKEKPSAITPLAKAQIDWSKTRVWGDGGYYARIFLNVRGREPQGIVEQADYEKLRDELVKKISAMRSNAQFRTSKKFTEANKHVHDIYV